MEKKYVGAIDQGTTSTRFILFNKNGEIVNYSQKEHKQIYPSPGYVEHDPLEIWNNTCEVISKTLKESNIKPEEISSIGVTNQRETTILWNPKTGKPYYNAIVWQDTRTDKICNNLKEKYGNNFFQLKTGLPLATYFSGPKIKWLLENIPDLKNKIKNNEVYFGNIDSWIIWNLTGGVNAGVHITDVTNASRTQLMNLKTLDWDNEILEILEIPKTILPEIKPSVEYNFYGYTKKDGPFNYEIPISGDLGDQQAALFGQLCFDVGQAKNTYGTGCFLLLNTGDKIINSNSGLLTTVGYKIGNNNAVYALEGSVAIAGSLVQWFRDKLGIIKSAPEINELAGKVPDNGGVYIVPAFTGLFAPYWRSDARGVIVGLTHFVTKEHLARAVLEATAFQTKDIFMAMEKDSGIKLKSLKVDGGMVKSEILMQFQADILNVPVICPEITETTSLGVAYAAGLATGFWESIDELTKNWKIHKEWTPSMDDSKRNLLYNFWLKAVERSMNWIS